MRLRKRPCAYARITVRLLVGRLHTATPYDLLMRPRSLAIPLALLALAGCASSTSLAEVPDACDLPRNSWLSDSQGLSVVTEGVAPTSEEQVQCILDEAGTSPELQNSIWVNAGPHPRPRETETEGGLRYSWAWQTETNLHLLVEPE